MNWLVFLTRCCSWLKDLLVRDTGRLVLGLIVITLLAWVSLSWPTAEVLILSLGFGWLQANVS